MNENIGKELLNYLLVQAIKDSRFKKVLIQKQDETVAISLDGEAFGIIGALAAAIHSVSKTADIPIDIILQMITTYSECMYIEKVPEGQIKSDPDVSPLLDLFGKYMEELKDNKEGEN